MKKNYYDILEINKNASPEIIEKAYKTLVKKYHPDLQEESKKQEYEEKLKIINEAYTILSNPEERKDYDLTLKENTISQEEYQDLYKENQTLKEKLNHLENQPYNTPTNESFNSINIPTDTDTVLENLEAEYKKQYQDSINQAYHDAYIQDLKNRGYKIHYKKSLKDYIKSLVALSGVILFLLILWQIPFVRNYFISLYNTNPIIKVLVDFVLNLFK